MHDAQELTCPLLDALRVISEIQSVRKCKKIIFSHGDDVIKVSKCHFL